MKCKMVLVGSIYFEKSGIDKFLFIRSTSMQSNIRTIIGISPKEMLA